MDEIEVVLKKFGDEQSTLLDQFERLSFEVKLNQAILGRSISEPGAFGSRLLQAPPTRRALQPRESQVSRPGRRPRRSRFEKLLKMLIKPILCRKERGCTAKGEVPIPKDPKSWNVFSRSLRV